MRRAVFQTASDAVPGPISPTSTADLVHFIRPSHSGPGASVRVRSFSDSGRDSAAPAAAGRPTPGGASGDAASPRRPERGLRHNRETPLPGARGGHRRVGPIPHHLRVQRHQEDKGVERNSASSGRLDPVDAWTQALGAWAIPEDILAMAPESPWQVPPEWFARRADLQIERREGRSIARAEEALGAGGSVLDVGAGAGARSPVSYKQLPAPET
jgi:hypothetical protein